MQQWVALAATAIALLMSGGVWGPCRPASRLGRSVGVSTRGWPESSLRVCMVIWRTEAHMQPGPAGSEWNELRTLAEPELQTCCRRQPSALRWADKGCVNTASLLHRYVALWQRLQWVATPACPYSLRHGRARTHTRHRLLACRGSTGRLP